MKEIVSHIECLLLDNECVVIPQFGAFVTSNVSARYIEEEKLFLPPMRTVCFNEQIKSDDGLLLNSYKNVYHCTELEARKKLGEQIRDIQQELWETGNCDLGSVGLLSLDEYNSIKFSPCQSGIACPTYYGLDALQFERKHIVEKPQVTSSKQIKVVDSSSDNEITIRLKKSWLRNIAVSAAAIMLFFVITPDAQNTGTSTANTAEFTNLMMFSSLSEKNSETLIEAPNVSLPQAEVQESQEPAIVIEEEQPDVESQEDFNEITGYCVVVASAIPESSAIAYVEQLDRNGYKGAQVYKKSGMIRVVFSGFASEQDARKRLNELSDASEEFAYAWIYKIK